jgi:pimeloyl-ACP methyl ester carboxylesterase
VNLETLYAKTFDGVHIAYQVIGSGPLDLVFISWLLNVENLWRWARMARTFRRMATFSRLILFVSRGTGMSDHAIDRDQAFSLDARMDDIRAVMDAAGSQRAVLFAVEDGFALPAMFAATYPERTVGLVAYATAARELWAPDYPWGEPKEDYDAKMAAIERGWGTKELARTWATEISPSIAEDDEDVEAFAAWMRSGGGPIDSVSFSRSIGRRTSGTSFPPCASPRASFIERMTELSRSKTVDTSPSTSRARCS